MACQSGLRSPPWGRNSLRFCPPPPLAMPAGEWGVPYRRYNGASRKEDQL